MTKTLAAPVHPLTLYMATVLVAFSLLLALVPAPARAAQLTEPQIEAVINLLIAFDADPATVANTEAALRGSASGGASSSNTSDASTTPPTSSPTYDNSSTGSSTPAVPPPPPTMGSCAIPARSLSYGSNGSDVQSLQNFLMNQGYLGAGDTTGFFGSSTQAALMRWQSKNGVVSSGNAQTTGWGSFGPLSQTLALRLCGGPNTSGNGMPHPMPPHQGNASTSTRPDVSSASGAVKPSCTLTASAQSVNPGDSVTLTWSSTNAVYASTARGTVSPTPSGSITVTPTATTVYQKTVYGRGGSATCQATVSVVDSQNASTTNTTPAGAASTVQVMAQPDINIASAAAALAQLPFSLAINSLTGIFVLLGVH